MKRCHFFPFFFLLGLVFFSCENELPVSKYNEIAKSRLAQNEFDSCIYYAGKSLEADFNNGLDYYSHYLIAFSFDEKKEFLNASKSYLKALATIPEGKAFDDHRVSILKNIGRLCKIHGNYGQAIRYYQKALEYVGEADRAGLMFNLGNAYKGKEDYEEAQKTYLAALQVALDNNDMSRQVKIYHQLGLLYSELKDYGQARSYYQTVINYENGPTIPSNYEHYLGRSLHNMGSSFLYEGNYQQAVEYLLQAIKYKSKEKDLFITYMDLGTSFTKLGDFGLAHAYYAKAESIYSQVEPTEKNIEVFNLMNLSYRASGDLKKSLAYGDQYTREIKKFLHTRNEMIQQFNSTSFAKAMDDFHKGTDRAARFKALVAGNWILIAVLIIAIFWALWFYRKKRSIMSQGKKAVADLNSFIKDFG